MGQTWSANSVYTDEASKGIGLGVHFDLNNVTNEAITGTIGSLSRIPIVPGSVVLTNGTETFTDNASNVLVSNLSGGNSGTIDYTDGAWTVTGWYGIGTQTASYVAVPNLITIHWDDLLFPTIKCLTHHYIIPDVVYPLTHTIVSDLMLSYERGTLKDRNKWTGIEQYSKYVDLMQLVPEKFRSSVALQQFLYVCGLQVGSWIGDINDLQAIIDKYRVGDTYIQNLADLVGIDLIITPTTTFADKQRQLLQVIDWYKIKGTYQALKVIAYTLGVSTSITDLYTKDYISFVSAPWYAGPVGSNPPNIAALADGNSYYKSPHFGMNILLDQLYPSQGSGSPNPYPYLWDGSMYTPITQYVELVMPVNTVPEYSIILTAQALELGSPYGTAVDVFSTITSHWVYSSGYFDGGTSPAGTKWNFDEGDYFDQSTTAFLNDIIYWKMGTGNKGVIPDRDTFALEYVVLDNLSTGTGITYTNYPDRIEFIFTIPSDTVQSSLSEMGLFLSDGTMVVASTFPDIDLTGGVALQVIVQVYHNSNLDILYSYQDALNLYREDQTWLSENNFIEWFNLYNVTYNRPCVSMKTADRWDTWDGGAGKDWDTALIQQYEWDLPVVAEDYYAVSPALNLGPSFAGLVADFSMAWHNYTGSTTTHLQARTSPDGVTWTAWTNFTLGFVVDQYFQVQGYATIANPYYKVASYDSTLFIAIPVV